MMERLAELIGKLKEQFEQKADSSKLLATTLLIERELTKSESSKTPAVSSSMVSVVMPAVRNAQHHQAAAIVEEERLQQRNEAPDPKPKETAAEPSVPEFVFDPMTEIPTLSQQHSIKEINDG